MKKEKKQPRNVVGEIQAMLKKAVNTSVPMIIDTPPETMAPQAQVMSKEDLDSYNFEMLHSCDCNICPISKAKESVRFNKAVNAFRHAGFPANSYTHIAYYQIPSNGNEMLKKYRYVLLW